MARTVRSIIQAAQRKFGALVSGDNTSADEMTDGLEAYNGLVRAIQGGIGSRLSNQPALTVSATAEVGGLYRGPASSITITCPANPRHGARFGVALRGYPGTYSAPSPSVPIMGESRFTYVLGGVMKTVAPYFGAALGFSSYTSSVSVPVENSDGKRTVDAHAIGGHVKSSIRAQVRTIAGVLVHLEPFEPRPAAASPPG